MGRGGGRGLGEDVEVDMKNRDPQHLNPATRVLFHDVVGEPPGAHSADCVWKNSFKCYRGGMNCCYSFLTFLCALPAALCWGCQFACITFNQIWCVTPFIRCFNMVFVCLGRFWYTLVRCQNDPINESVALICTQCFHHQVNDGKSYQPRRLEEINLMVGGASITEEHTYEVPP